MWWNYWASTVCPSVSCWPLLHRSHLFKHGCCRDCEPHVVNSHPQYSLHLYTGHLSWSCFSTPGRSQHLLCGSALVSSFLRLQAWSDLVAVVAIKTVNNEPNKRSKTRLQLCLDVNIQRNTKYNILKVFSQNFSVSISSTWLANNFNFFKSFKFWLPRFSFVFQNQSCWLDRSVNWL